MQERVDAAIQEISINPYRGKHLTGDLYCFWSWRIGKVRIIYRIDETNKEVILYLVEFREEAY